MADKSWEARTLLSYGSQFRIDVNNPQVTVGGEDVYNIYGITDEEDVCLMGLQQNGIFRIYNNKTVEIVGGQKTSENGVDVVISGKNGDVIINADKNGRVRIRGKNIVLQADEDVDITGGRNVNIKSGSGRVLLGGNTLEKAGLKGNLLDPEQNWAFRVFEGTGLPGGAFGSLISGFGGISNLATNLVANPAAFGQLVGGAVQTGLQAGLGAATGGLSGVAGGALNSTIGNLGSSLLGGGGLGGDLLGGITNAATGALGDIAGDFAGDLGGSLTSIAGDAIGGLDFGSGILGDALSGVTDFATNEIGNVVSDISSSATQLVRDRTS